MEQRQNQCQLSGLVYHIAVIAGGSTLCDERELHSRLEMFRHISELALSLNILISFYIFLYFAQLREK